MNSMEIDALRDYLISMPSVEECYPFGPTTAVYKTGGKMFALLSVDGETPSMNLKCNPDLAIELREQYDFVIPGYHQNKKHWNTIQGIDSVPYTLLKTFIDHSYDLVCIKPKASKKIS